MNKIIEKSWQIILAIVGCVGTFFLGYNKGKENQRQKQDKQLLNNVIKADKIHTNNSNLTRDQLIDKL